MQVAEGRKKFKTGVALCIIMVIVLTVTLIYVEHVSDVLFEADVDEIIEESETDIDSLTSYWKNSFNFADQVTKYISVTDDDEIQKAIDVLDTSIKGTNIEYAFVTDINGNIITKTNIPDGMIEYVDYESLKKGESTISDVYKDVVPNPKSIDTKYLLIFSAPIKVAGVPLLVVNLAIDRENVFNRINISTLGRSKVSYLVNKKGEVLYRLEDTVTSNQIADVLKSEYSYNLTEDEIIAQLTDDESGYFIMKEKERSTVAIHIPVGNGINWYVISLTDESEFNESTNRLLEYVLLLFFVFIIVLIIMYIIISMYEKENKAKVYNLAYFDTLTQVGNRNYLEMRYKELTKHSSKKYAYASIDIDNFKFVNNLVGYERGNEILKLVGEEISIQLQANETIARLENDIFGIMIEFIDRTDVVFKIEELMELVKVKLMDVYAQNLHLEFSCGIYIIEDNSMSIRTIIDSADIARKKVKSKFDKHIEFYAQEMMNEISERNSIEEKMEKALSQGEFKVYLQPKMNMITTMLVGAEALVRWKTGSGSILNPNNFIPIFEKNGFIVKLDFYVFEEVCKKISQWLIEGIKVPVISINISRLHLYNKDFVSNLKNIAKKYEVSTSLLEIEITENAFFEDSNMLIEVTNELKNAGFLISVDDFGSGYSSLNMLKDIPVDIIKIDKQFLEFTDNNERGKRILKNIIIMAKDLHMEIVVEGVETKEQVNMLTNYGCEIAQGYYYSKPMDIEAYEIYANDHKTVKGNKIIYEFRNNLLDNDGRNEAKMIGDQIQYVIGPLEGSLALYFPGGDIGVNVVKFPKEVLLNDSYTIAMWIKIDEFIEFTSLFYAEYLSGFMSIMPIAWKGAMAFRIKEHKDPLGWYDTAFTQLMKTDKWYHIAVSYNSKILTARLYLDGRFLAQLEGVPCMSEIHEVILGGDVYQPSFRGSIANLVFCNQVKSAVEIEEMYQEIYINK